MLVWKGLEELWLLGLIVLGEITLWVQDICELSLQFFDFILQHIFDWFAVKLYMAGYTSGWQLLAHFPRLGHQHFLLPCGCVQSFRDIIDIHYESCLSLILLQYLRCLLYLFLVFILLQYRFEL